MLKKLIKYKLDYISVFLIMLGYYGWLQWHNYIGDPDGFYHAKIATFLAQGKLLDSLPWMQFTTLTEYFTDHHLLYHILLVPFTYLTDPLIAVKIAAVLFTALMIVVFYWLLKKLHVAYPYIFTLLFITLSGTNFRLSLIKVTPLSLLIIWLLIYALFTRKIWLLLILAFIFVWLYAGWPLAVLIAIIYLITDSVYNHFHKSKLKLFWNKVIHVFKEEKTKVKNWIIFLIILAGIVLGLLINPYNLHNLYFYYQQIIQIALINMVGQLPVGSEWYGTNIMKVISAAPHLFVLSSIIIVFLVGNYNRISKKTWFSFFLAFAFLLLTIKSRRYVEYFYPFLLLFTACGFTDLKKLINWKKIKRAWRKLGKALRIYLFVSFLILSILIMPHVFKQILTHQYPKNWPMGKFQASSEWLKSGTPEGSIVFHSSWDEWPLLFYYNTHNHYIVGLDPTFMYNFDPELSQLYYNITTGEDNYNVIGKINNTFKADYIFISKRDRHQKFINNVEKSKAAQLLYEDEEAKIYMVIGVK